MERLPDLSPLNAACQDSCPCGLVVAGDTSVVPGVMRGLTGTDLVIDVWSESDHILVVPPAVVCLMFTHGGSSHAFLSRVVEASGYGSAGRPRYGPVSDRATQIRVLLPESLSGLQARMSFRLPVPAGMVELQLDGDANSVPPEILDLSRTGMQIELDYAAPALQVGSRHLAHLRTRNASVELRAEVRRKTGQRYGLFFCELVSREEVTPPPGLEQIIRQVDTRWSRWRDAG